MFDVASGFLYALLYSGSTNYTGFLLTYDRWYASIYTVIIATVYKGNIIKNLIMDCQSYTKYRPNETTGGIFVSWRRKEELPTGGLTEKLSLFFHAKKQEVNAYGR